MKMHGRIKFREMTNNEYRKPVEKRIYDAIKTAEEKGNDEIMISLSDASYVLEMLLYHYNINYKRREFEI